MFKVEKTPNKTIYDRKNGYKKQKRFEKLRKQIEEYKHKKNQAIFIEELRELPEPQPRKWIPPEEQEKLLPHWNYGKLTIILCHSGVVLENREKQRRFYYNKDFLEIDLEKIARILGLDYEFLKEKWTTFLSEIRKPNTRGRVLILPYKKREWVFVYGDKKTRGPNRFLSNPNNIYVSDIAIDLDCDPKLIVEALNRWDRKHGKTIVPKPKTVFLKFIKDSKSYDYVGDYNEIDVFEISEFFGLEPKQVLGKILVFRESNLNGKGVIEF